MFYFHESELIIQYLKRLYVYVGCSMCISIKPYQMYLTVFIYESAVF